MAFNGEIRKINMRIRRMYEYCWCHAIKDHLVAHKHEVREMWYNIQSKGRNVRKNGSNVCGTLGCGLIRRVAWLHRGIAVLFCFALLRGVAFAGGNSYVSIEIAAESGRVVCLGSDFLVIPFDPFSDESVHVDVSAEVGWILKSSASLDIIPGQGAGWEVEGDSDNPEDLAAGCIYVAKVVLLSDTVDLLRSCSTNITFTTTPSFAKEYISFSIRPADSVLPMRSGAKAGGAQSPIEVTASVDTLDSLLSFQNTIEAVRRAAGSNSQAFYFEAERGSRIVTVQKKKDVNSIYDYIEQDAVSAFRDIISPKRIVRDWTKSILKQQVDDFDMLPKDMKDGYTSIFDQTAGCVSSLFPDSINISDFTLEYRDKVKPGLIVDEGWTWNLDLVLDVVFTGGIVSLSPKRDLSLFNWGNAVVQSGGFDSHLLDYQCVKAGAKITVDGHSAIGTCPIIYRFSFSATKQFEDIAEWTVINSGNFSFDCFFGISINF